MSSSTEEKKEKDLFVDKAAAKLEEEERKVKKTKDYLPEITAALPSILDPVDNDASALPDAISQLYAWERKARLAADTESTQLVAETILRTCVKVGAWDALNDNITYLVKCRAQLVKVIRTVVLTGMDFLADVPPAHKRALLNVLREASEGRIFLEAEYADLTMRVAKMMEAEGDVAGAADTLQQVAVETIGAMELIDRAAYLLEQLRLCLAKKDYLRAELVAKKIRTKQLLGAGWEQVRARYHALMARLHAHAQSWLDVAKAHLELYRVLRARDGLTAEEEAERLDAVETGMADEGNARESAWARELELACVFALLAPADYETRELLTRISAQADMTRIPAYHSAVQQVLGEQLVQWPLADPVSALYRAGTANVLRDPVFTEAIEDEGCDYKARAELLKTRIAQRNVLTLTKTHKAMKMSTLAALLGLTEEEAEECVCGLVADGQLQAGIDRATATVTLGAPPTVNSILQKWSDSIDELFELVESTAHMVMKARC